MKIYRLAQQLDAKYNLMSQAKDPDEDKPFVSNPGIEKINTARVDRALASCKLELRDAVSNYIHAKSGTRANSVLENLANYQEPLSMYLINGFTELHENFDHYTPEKIYSGLTGLHSMLNRKSVNEAKDKIKSLVINPARRKEYETNFEAVTSTLSSIVNRISIPLHNALLKPNEFGSDTGVLARERVAPLTHKIMEFVKFHPAAKKIGIESEKMLSELFQGEDGGAWKERFITYMNAATSNKKNPRDRVALHQQAMKINEQLAAKKRNSSLDFKATMPGRQDDDIEKLKARQKKIQDNQPEVDRAFRMKRDIANELEDKYQTDKLQEEEDAVALRHNYLNGPQESRMPVIDEEALEKKYSNMSFEQWYKRGSK